MTDSAVATAAIPVPAGDIVLDGVRVHNLRGISLHIKRNTLTVICGVSGSGKSSLAFDTLFAEGQRRYVESFSPYARQFLDQVERPDVDRIEGIPPAIAIRQNIRTQSARSTVGTRTEILDFLRVLFAKAGQLECRRCQQPAVLISPESAADYLVNDFEGRRAMLTVAAGGMATVNEWLADGFARGIANETAVSLTDIADEPTDQVEIVTDRVRIADDTRERLTESLEQAFSLSPGLCTVLIQTDRDAEPGVEHIRMVDGTAWQALPLYQGWMCTGCGQSFAELTAERLNFQSTAGACSACEGSGQVSGMTFQKVVPDDRLSLKDGAITPWTTPAYRHELDELLALAPDYGIPVDVPFSELTDEHKHLINSGVADRDFGGLVGFHRWLVRNRYKKGVAVFLNRWRSWLTCDQCCGRRLANDGSAVRLGGQELHEVCTQEISDAVEWLTNVEDSLSADLAQVLSTPLRQLRARLNFLRDCGLDYLSLDRQMSTLSGGEAQRVVLTSVLGSGLINTLYVLDEPTSGLHAGDTRKVIATARKLQQSGNTVVVVEHDPDFIQAADDIIEIGPGAGAAGGEVVFQGTPAALRQASTATADAFMTNQSDDGNRPPRPVSDWITFSGVHCHNIHDLSGKIPVNGICAVTGVSGSGKSSLVTDTLYPAICRQIGQPCDHDSAGTIKSVHGVDEFAHVLLLDQSPLARSRRSIPATVVDVFSEIRSAMAATHEARKRNYKPGMFSFNSPKGGRCPQCEGHGVVTIEMQFLADIQTTCEACSGRRFRSEVLEVRYRDRSVHDILMMTGEDAFTFFSGYRKIQQRLNALRQAGLGYIRLGQPVSTLSGGESQRLRIAALLAGVPTGEELPSSRNSAGKSESQRTLFILDEPSTGLHLRDIDALMQCLNHLVEIGHTVIVIEHDEAVIRRADYVIEMGPGPGQRGGKIVAAGPAPR